MDAPTTIAGVLGAGGFFTAVVTAWTSWRERKTQAERHEGELKLSKAQQQHVAQEAAAISSADRIATERWWKEQFDAVRIELAGEQVWRRKITKYIRRHQPWDMEMERIARENDWPISPAPRIDLTGEDDDDDKPMDTNPWHQ